MKSAFYARIRATIGVAAVALSLAAPLPATAQDNSNSDLSNPDSAFAGRHTGSHHARIERTERGHLMGNPEAEAQLIEFVSYTCGHCADFTRQGEGAMELLIIAPGKMSLEVRPVIRNGVDLAVSLLAQCGDPAGFKQRHRMFMLRQDQWMAAARQAPQSQLQIWARGDAAARLNVAQALDLDDMLAERGMSKSDINACLSDNQAALALVRNSNADQEEYGIPGTPSFALDGEYLADVHSWQQLSPVLQARFRPETAQN